MSGSLKLKRGARQGLLGAAMGLGALMLAGCGSTDGELREWMEQQKREVKPSVTPLSPPKRFDPQGYLAADVVPPFGGGTAGCGARPQPLVDGRNEPQA
jgi:Tfp pilus assembly protein PilP